MKFDELCRDLREGYTKRRGYGTTHVTHPEYKNILFVVPPPPPKLLPKKIPYNSVSRAMKVLGSVSLFHEMSDLDKLINFLFVRREAVQSSRLEGTWSTIDHILSPGDLLDKGDAKDEHISVRGYAYAIENMFNSVLEKKEKIFTRKLILGIHKNILTYDPNSSGSAGEFRKKNVPGGIVTIGGALRKENSIYNPAPPEYVEECIAHFLEWLSDRDFAEMGDAGSGFVLPIRMAIGHSHFEAIHPFTDGNGRTGRALWPLQMVASGHMPLYLSGFVEVNNEHYAKALSDAQKKLNYSSIIEFVSEAIVESSLEMKKTRDAILKLYESWKVRLKPRGQSAAERTLGILQKSPIICSESLQRELKISGPASTRAINQLLLAKIIRQRKTERRKRIYAAEEMIEILARPFGSDIEVALQKASKLLEREPLL